MANPTRGGHAPIDEIGIVQTFFQIIVQKISVIQLATGSDEIYIAIDGVDLRPRPSDVVPDYWYFDGVGQTIEINRGFFWGTEPMHCYFDLLEQGAGGPTSLGLVGFWAEEINLRLEFQGTVPVAPSPPPPYGPGHHFFYVDFTQTHAHYRVQFRVDCFGLTRRGCEIMKPLR
jgi:hypothetical protein